ncbi:hypothetical protein DFH11DRAFT_1631415 [Phellopilus nigrolimitatus]|nr:hypothetical protein DFH11DRAFT_1631415 [Phellopilus nigrolimitatus]
MSQSQQDPPSASADSQCQLLIEVDFKNGRPKYKITVKLEVDGQTLTHKFGKEGVVRWECNRDFVPSARLKITVKQVLFLVMKKVFAVIDVNMLDHAGKRLVEVEDGQKKVVLKLTFDVPEPKCKAQEEYRAIVRDLLEDMTLHLPFTKTHALDESKYAVTKETLGKMLKKIEEASKFVDVNSTQSVIGINSVIQHKETPNPLHFIGELLSSEPKMKEANGLRDGFRKLKEVYDWCIKAESWRTSLNIGRSCQLKKTAYENT